MEAQLSMGLVRRIMMHILEGVLTCHSLNIIHRSAPASARAVLYAADDAAAAAAAAAAASAAADTSQRLRIPTHAWSVTSRSRQGHQARKHSRR